MQFSVLQVCKVLKSSTNIIHRESIKARDFFQGLAKPPPTRYFNFFFFFSFHLHMSAGMTLFSCDTRVTRPNCTRKKFILPADSRNFPGSTLSSVEKLINQVSNSRVVIYIFSSTHLIFQIIFYRTSRSVVKQNFQVRPWKFKKSSRQLILASLAGKKDALLNENTCYRSFPQR